MKKPCNINSLMDNSIVVNPPIIVFTISKPPSPSPISLSMPFPSQSAPARRTSISHPFIRTRTPPNQHQHRQQLMTTLPRSLINNNASSASLKWSTNYCSFSLSSPKEEPKCLETGPMIHMSSATRHLVHFYKRWTTQFVT